MQRIVEESIPLYSPITPRHSLFGKPIPTGAVTEYGAGKHWRKHTEPLPCCGSTLCVVIRQGARVSAREVQRIRDYNGYFVNGSDTIVQCFCCASYWLTTTTIGVIQGRLKMVQDCVD